MAQQLSQDWQVVGSDTTDIATELTVSHNLIFFSFKHPNKPHMGDPNTRGFSLPEVVVDDVIFAAGRSPNKAHPKLHPTYTMMPEKWAEVTDTKSGWDGKHILRSSAFFRSFQ